MNDIETKRASRGARERTHARLWILIVFATMLIGLLSLNLVASPTVEATVGRIQGLKELAPIAIMILAFWILASGAIFFLVGRASVRRLRDPWASSIAWIRDSLWATAAVVMLSLGPATLLALAAHGTVAPFEMTVGAGVLSGVAIAFALVATVLTVAILAK